MFSFYSESLKAFREKKEVISCQVHPPQELFWTVFACSSLNLRDCQHESRVCVPLTAVSAILNLSMTGHDHKELYDKHVMKELKSHAVNNQSKTKSN